MTTIDSVPYGTALEHARDEFALVGSLVGRAIQRGRVEGWLAPAAAAPGAEVTNEAIAAQLVRIEQRLAARRETGTPLPMDILRRRFGLSTTEQRVLWALIGFELDPRLRQLLRHVRTEDGAGVAAGSLLAAIYDPDPATGLVELSVDGRLTRFALIERDAGERAGGSLSQRVLTIADRIPELASGLVRLDPEIARHATFLDAPPSFAGLIVPDDRKAAVVDLVRAAALAEAPFAITLVTGLEGSGRRSLAFGAAEALGLPALVVRCGELPKDGARFEPMLRAIIRESVLLSAVLVLADVDRLDGDPERGVADRVELLDRAGLSALPGPVVATAAQAARPLRVARGVNHLELGIPPEGDRLALWHHLIGEVAEPALLDQVAARYPVTGGVITSAATAAMARAAAQDTPLSITELHEAVRGVMDAGLGGLGIRITTSQDWDDIVLPPETLAEVQEMIARVKHRRQVYEDWGFARKLGRGLGLSAMFSGPPGTGKTMVAGLIARELGLDLYQVDLSRVVSKWVGETEKNLAALFAAAEAGHAVLLFDEADSLFAKRTDVKSSMDRYANLEVNYLLQRMEAFAGVTVLTTNHDATIDDAFRRRLSFRIDFPMPERDERERLWRALIPAQATLAGDVDFEALGDRYELSGGYIRNVVLRAAFFAADAAQPIAMEHLRRAASLEMSAMGKVI